MLLLLVPQSPNRDPTETLDPQEGFCPESSHQGCFLYRFHSLLPGWSNTLTGVGSETWKRTPPLMMPYRICHTRQGVYSSS